MLRVSRQLLTGGRRCAVVLLCNTCNTCNHPDYPTVRSPSEGDVRPCDEVFVNLELAEKQYSKKVGPGGVTS